MKVKCKNIYNEHTENFQETSPWLTVGKEYVILEILISQSKKISYRLVRDNVDKSPSIFISSKFDIISDLIPSNWGISVVNMSLIILGPIAWHQPDFWDLCYDGDLAALEIYKRETRIIMQEENLL